MWLTCVCSLLSFLKMFSKRVEMIWEGSDCGVEGVGVECWVGSDLVLISVLWSLVWHSAWDWVRQGEHTWTRTNITHTHTLLPHIHMAAWIIIIIYLKSYSFSLICTCKDPNLILIHFIAKFYLFLIWLNLNVVLLIYLFL